MCVSCFWFYGFVLGCQFFGFFHLNRSDSLLLFALYSEFVKPTGDALVLTDGEESVSLILDFSISDELCTL